MPPDIQTKVKVNHCGSRLHLYFCSASGHKHRSVENNVRILHRTVGDVICYCRGWVACGLWPVPQPWGDFLGPRSHGALQHFDCTADVLGKLQPVAKMKGAGRDGQGPPPAPSPVSISLRVEFRHFFCVHIQILPVLCGPHTYPHKPRTHLHRPRKLSQIILTPAHIPHNAHKICHTLFI